MRRFNPSRDKLPGDKGAARPIAAPPTRTARAAPSNTAHPAPKPAPVFTASVQLTEGAEEGHRIDWNMIGVGRAYPTVEAYLQAKYGPPPYDHTRLRAEYLAPVFPQKEEPVPYRGARGNGEPRF